MIEENLSNPTRSPAEVALALRNWVEVELAVGGATEEKRFFDLFPMLCDRVFGKLSEKEFRHEVGGWLSRPQKWERPNMSVPSSSHHRLHRTSSSSGGSVKTDQVVKLLGAKASMNSEQQHALSLIEAFAKEAEHRPNVRYHFPFRALPQSTQDAWIALIETALGGVAKDLPPSENSSKLLKSCLRVKPLEQNQLRAYHQSKAQKQDQRRPLQLSPMYNSPKSTPKPPNAKDKETQPKILLSMLEYYLMVFVRYPLAAPALPPKQQSQSPVPHRPGTVLPARRGEPYGETVYYYLFQEYVNYYIPAGAPQGHWNGFPILNRPSELFLRFVIELWLEGQNQLAPTAKAIKAVEERRPGTTQFDLNLSYDLVKGKYLQPSYQIPRCLHKLIARAASDGAILDVVRDVHNGFRGAEPEVLCLNPAMTILQVPFYNYIRNTFRHASIHAKHSPFYSALNDWLMWLEPWNTKHSSGRNDPRNRIMDKVSRTSHEQTSSSARVTYPKSSHRSLYQSCWEPYIASNLHLYTVPLAIFLRRARELDFSPTDYYHSMNTVKRVFRVFSPAVMAVINKLLTNRASGSPLSSIVAKHEKLLGAHGPPSTPLSLSSCQDDMHNLLEEICLQHLKKLEDMEWPDRVGASIQNWFGQGAYRGEEKELSSLVAKAKVIVGFPHNYEPMPKTKPASKETARSIGGFTDRTSNGLFSDHGRERLIYGLSKCDAQDIGYIGDTMLARPQSFEIAWLVPILVHASQFLNSRLGIHYNVGEGMDHHSSFFPKRINLRFLADCRNLVYICILTFFYKITH